MGIFGMHYLRLWILMHKPEAYTYDDEEMKKAEATGKPGLVEINLK